MTQAFNLSQLANNVNTSGQLNAAAGLYNQVPVANGGTGRASVASGNILVGAGTSAMTALAGSATNDVVTWNGTAWVSAVSAGGAAPVVTIYTSPATWTKPATLKAVKVTIASGGGGGGGGRSASTPFSATPGGGGGGGSGFGYFQSPAIPGPVAVTVGTGGAGGVVPAPGPVTYYAGSAGTTSSFGTLISATGGGGGTASGSTTPTVVPAPGPGGVITPSPAIFGINGAAGSTGVGGNVAFGFGILPNLGYSVGGAGGGFSGPGSNNGTSGRAGFVIVEEFY